NPNVTVTTITFSPNQTTTFNAGSGNWTVQNAMTITTANATFNANSSSITIGGDVTFANASTFSAGTSTVAFNGSSKQTINVSSKTFATIDVTNTAVDGIRWMDSLTVATFTALSQGTTMQFQTGTSSLTVTSY